MKILKTGTFLIPLEEGKALTVDLAEDFEFKLDPSAIPDGVGSHGTRGFEINPLYFSKEERSSTVGENHGTHKLVSSVSWVAVRRSLGRVTYTVYRLEAD